MSAQHYSNGRPGNNIKSSSPTKRKKLIFLYASIFVVGLIYNFGEFVGKQMYLLGV